MKYTCICPTYGRVGRSTILLEETIQSFLMQDEKDGELIILNDHPQQRLIFTHDRVRVINLPHKIKSLGIKYNLMVEIANGDIILPFEDDDISLPWRVSHSLQELGNNHYYNPRRYWLYANGKLIKTHSQGVGHACSAYRRSSMLKIGGYANTTGNQDMVADTDLVKAYGAIGSIEDGGFELPHDKWFYIYRWDSGSFHLSGDTSIYENDEALGVKFGEFHLEPRWRVDYTKEVTNNL